MSDTQYVLWFIGMAFVIASLLSFGVLTMSGSLHRREDHATIHAHPRHAEHHHWYDRFHHAA
ncbi:hypothetical protein F0U44_07880 [Nocardioides humilatus]|uniref:Uncharacterized protein n=1 Tax=Nocardioides humilatus TaxID=2607660 RepID=A0A5B1LI35_9ACTN|nr:hypothetical protein [Nocardioides humilatus]KAA1420323.1 hypothetical protein F0U44_07880 [Nocardioides humilatus]